MSINFRSLGFQYPPGYERSAFQQFYENGVLIVAAAGNEATSQYIYPASYDSVISVAGMDYS
jgi:serine protease